MKFMTIIALAMTTLYAAPVEANGSSNACGASELQYLIGSDKQVLETMRFSKTVRVIGPGMMVTTDYVPDRLNIEYDKKDVIIKVYCG